MDKIYIYNFILILFFFILFLFIIIFTSKKEGFYNYYLNNSGSIIGKDGDNLLLQSQYPLTNNKTIQDINYNQIWWNYPELKLSNYAQITNNIRYNKRPDIATAIPAEFNDLFYKQKPNKSNIICQLPPVITDKNQVRVGFFNTNVDLLY